MLLVGPRALCFWTGDPTPPSDPWLAWSTPAALEEWLRRAGGRVSQREPGADGVVHRVLAGGTVLTVSVFDEDSAEAGFVAANADAPELPVGSGTVRVARPSSLALILRSGMYAVPGWHPRILAYHTLKDRGEPSASETEREAYERRLAHFRARPDCNPKNHSMRVSNEAFFGAFRAREVRFYHHDELHAATCYYDEPLYLSLKEDRSLAYIPRARFERLAFEDKLRLVREECYALALERVIIPARELGVPCAAQSAFLYGLHRICTDVATGWFRDFAIDHFPRVCAFDTDFVERFETAERAGRVRRTWPRQLPAERLHAVRVHLEEIAERARTAGLPVGFDAIALAA